MPPLSVQTSVANVVLVLVLGLRLLLSLTPVASATTTTLSNSSSSSFSSFSHDDDDGDTLIAQFCHETRLKASEAWICHFSLEPIVKCFKNSSTSVSVEINSRNDLALLEPRIAFINVSECSSILTDSLPLHLLSTFHNFAIGVNIDHRHAHDCPYIHVLSSTFKRINHQAKCLVLANTSQELLDSTENLDRFDALQEFVMINSTFSKLPENFYKFIENSQVQHLVIRNTNLDDFDLDFSNANQSLQLLDLSNNKLTRIQVGSNWTFNKIQLVDFSHNRLFLSPQFLNFDHTTTVVDLSFNGLPTVGDFVGQMHCLNLSHNRIVEIQPSTFRQIHSLAILDLSFNSLSHLPQHDDFLGSRLHLVELNLSHNNIQELPNNFLVGAATLLARLDLSFNKLQSLTEQVLNFSKMPMLEFLNLRNNQLVSLPDIQPHSNHLYLQLSNNLLTSLTILPTKFSRQIKVNASNVSFFVHSSFSFFLLYLSLYLYLELHLRLS